MNRLTKREILLVVLFGFVLVAGFVSRFENTLEILAIAAYSILGGFVAVCLFVFVAGVYAHFILGWPAKPDRENTFLD